MVLVAGSANLDFVVRAPHIPAPGETVLGGGLQTFAGGKGANQALACARAGGVATHMLLALGKDAFAAPIEASLRGAGVTLHTLHPIGVPTGTAFICVDEHGENAITVAPGANACLQAEHLPPLQGFSHLLMQLEIPLPTVAAYAHAAKAADVRVVLNAAPAQTLGQELLAAVDLLVLNEGELRALAGDGGSVLDCLACLPCPAVVVTLGARGCVAREGNAFHAQASFQVPVVDTTGAGDTFCGTLVAALAGQHTMAHALRQASAAAALTCTQMGAQSSVPYAADVAAFLIQASQANEAQSLLALRQFAGLP
ncbi:MAG: ribokinase [Betaproteobacteria bacterium]